MALSDAGDRYQEVGTIVTVTTTYVQSTLVVCGELCPFEAKMSTVRGPTWSTC